MATSDERYQKMAEEQAKRRREVEKEADRIAREKAASRKREKKDGK